MVAALIYTVFVRMNQRRVAGVGRNRPGGWMNSAYLIPNSGFIFASVPYLWTYIHVCGIALYCAWYIDSILTALRFSRTRCTGADVGMGWGGGPGGEGRDGPTLWLVAVHYHIYVCQRSV